MAFGAGVIISAVAYQLYPLTSLEESGRQLLVEIGVAAGERYTPTYK